MAKAKPRTKPRDRVSAIKELINLIETTFPEKTRTAAKAELKKLCVEKRLVEKTGKEVFKYSPAQIQKKLEKAYLPKQTLVEQLESLFD